MENEIEKTEQIDHIEKPNTDFLSRRISRNNFKEKPFAFFHAEEISHNQNDWTWQKSDKVEF